MRFSPRVAILVVLSIVPVLSGWAVFGPLIVEDSRGYLDYAAELRAGLVNTGPALLGESAVPISLFRMGGYPAILAILQTVSGQAWLNTLVLLQVLSQAVITAGSYRAARVLGVGPRLASVSALLPAVGLSLVMQLCVLTDALYGALLTGAALLLIIKSGTASRMVAGALIAGATTLREATIFVAVGYLPLAIIGRDRQRRFLLGVASIVALPLCVAAAQIGWNVSRGAGPVLTTSRQTVMIQAVLPLLKAGYPVYDGNDLFDCSARATVGIGGYLQIDELHRRLFAAGMTAPEIAARASQRYQSAWTRFPLPMAAAALKNLRFNYLAMPFEPIETLRDLVIFAGYPRPAFMQFGQEWRRMRQGDPVAILTVIVDCSTRLLGFAIGIVGVLGPWLPGVDGRARALWCVCAGLVAVYLPVHIEPRYLMPITPLLCLLAVVSLGAIRARSHLETWQIGAHSFRRLSLEQQT